MRIELRELMDKLGVRRILHPYETQPWCYKDEEQGIEAMAEVRMSPDSDEVIAELQFIHDNPSAGTPPVEQICYLRATPVMQKKWSTIDLFIRREDYKNKIYNWEEKACNFFRACIREIRAERIPDIDDLLNREMSEGGVWSDRVGDTSNRSPKIQTNQLLYDMKPGPKGGM